MDATGSFYAGKAGTEVERKEVEPKELEPKIIGLFQLFILFVKIGLVTIGGGYVMIPLLQQEFVVKRKLMNMKDFCNIMAIAQAGPGGVAINSSTVVGYNLRGLSGAIIATVGTVLPSFLVIVFLAAWLLQHRNTGTLEGFLSGATPAVVGLLISAAYSLGREVIEDKIGAVLGLGSLIAVVIFAVHPIIVIIAAGVFGFIYYRNKVVPEDGENCEIR